MDHGEGILVGFKDWYPTKQSFNHVMLPRESWCMSTQV